MSAVLAPPADQLTRFEWAFIRTVLEHRGVFQDPSHADFDAAIAELREYDAQCSDNPGGGAWDQCSTKNAKPSCGRRHL
jgi:hypothetical protein